MENIMILETMKASPDGISVVEYEEGTVYELPDELADVFIENGWGEKYENDPESDDDSDPYSDLGYDGDPDPDDTNDDTDNDDLDEDD